MTTLVLTTAFARAAPVMGAFLFARFLNEQGEPVIFAALDDLPDGFVEEVKTSGVPHRSFHLGGWLGLRKRSIVQRFVAEHGIDCVMSDGLRPDLVNAGLRGVNRVSNVRGLLREHYALDFPAGVARFAAWAQVRALKKMDGVFAISREISDHLRGLGVSREKLRVVDNFIDVTDVAEAGKGGPDLGAGAHIGLFGALIQRKRIDVAIRGFASLLASPLNLNVKLHLVGEGRLRSDLADLAARLGVADQVVFHGFVTKPLPLMAKMDVVLLTSEREGVPRSLMEAMALGRTCVSSAFPGVESLIQNGETGLLFNPGDHEDLSRTLVEALGDGAIPSARLSDAMLKRHDISVCAPEMWRQIRQIAQAA